MVITTPLTVPWYPARRPGRRPRPGPAVAVPRRLGTAGGVALGVAGRAPGRQHRPAVDAPGAGAAGGPAGRGRDRRGQPPPHRMDGRADDLVPPLRAAG